MELFLLVLHVVAALAIVGLVLLQHGKGADVGAAFGTGSAGSVFGSAGSANFLSRATAILALVFFLTSLGLTYVSSRRSDSRGVMADRPASTQSAPAQVPVDAPVQRGPAQSAPSGAQSPAPAVPAEGGRAGEIPK